MKVLTKRSIQKIKWILPGIAIISAALVLASCPASSDPDQTTDTAVSGFASGVITAKGSIFVNGIEYETETSSVTVDNATGSDDDLQIGMVVDLKGTIDPETGLGIATEIDYASSIDGTVDAASIDLDLGTFTVFGLTIQTGALTVYEGIAGLAELADGERVEVSGMADSSGINASRIEVKTGDTDDFKVRGTVSELSGPTDGTFTLTLEDGSTRTVTFTGTLDAEIVNASLVKIEFTASEYTAATDTLDVAADKIELKHEISVEEGDRVEVEGIVENFIAGIPATFTVSGIEVSAGVNLISGITIADGMEITVKGLMSDGVLIASELELQEEADTELEGLVTSVDPSTGTLVLNGVTVYFNATTIFKDDSDTPVELFGLDDIASGDTVEIEAYTDDEGHTVAVKLERHTP